MSETKRDKRAELSLVFGLVLLSLYRWLSEKHGIEAPSIGLVGGILFYVSMYYATDHSTPQKSLNGYILAAAAMSSVLPEVATNYVWLAINVIVVFFSLVLVK